MFCTECGGQNPDTAKYCLQCGHAFEPPPAAAASESAHPEQIAFRFTGRGRDLLTADGLLFLLLAVSIVGAPWAYLRAARWFTGHVVVGTGATLRFTGRVGVVFGFFLALVIVGALQRVDLTDTEALGGPSLFLFLVVMTWSVGQYVLNVFLSWALTRWQFMSTVSSSGEPTAFSGGFAAYLGYQVLIILSFFTVVGWGWAGAAYLRWLSSHVHSGGYRGEFRGTGLQVLWRILVMIVGSVPIVTVPMMFCWFSRWQFSQTVGVPDPARLETHRAS